MSTELKDQPLRQQELAEMLGKSSILSNLNETQITDFAQKATCRAYKANEMVVKQGDQGSEFFFIMKGQARVIKEIDALFMDPGLDGLDKYKDHLELHSSREAIIAEFKIADCV